MGVQITAKADFLKGWNVSHILADKRLEDVARAVEQITLTDKHMSIGRTEIDVQAVYKRAGKKITGVDMTCDVRLYLPVWPNRSGAPEKEREEWARFLKALTYHELGHYDLYVRHCNSIYKQLVAASPDSFDGVLKMGQQTMNTDHDAYDINTDHGVKQNTPHGTTVISVQPQKQYNRTDIKTQGKKRSAVEQRKHNRKADKKK